MIEIKNMFFKYAGGGEQVFRNFSLQLQANNIYGLLGKNGTGKSTLLYLIDGLLRPQEGTVTVDGVVSSRRLPQTLSEIFLVPEEFDLPSVTLDEYIRLNAPFYPRFSREVLKECLNDFDLDDQLHLGKLSMGRLFVTLWTVAHQAPLSIGLQARILEWVAMPSSKGSSRSRDRTCVSCIGRRVLYH